jgi:uncharacterized RDD family membrane protein YckC
MRLVGQMIDSGFAMAPLIVLGAISKLTGGLAPPLMMIGSAWAGFYLLFGDGFHGGQSFAKQWLGMRVVDADNGAPCTWGESFIRNITLTLLGPIDWIFIFGDAHQRLGDKIVGTIVVTAD